MKKKFFASSILILLIVFSSFRNNYNPQDELNQLFQKGFTDFKTSLLILQSYSKTSLKDKKFDVELRFKYLELRKFFKTIEFLWTYSDPSFVKEYINGAPLPKLEENSFGPNVIEPHGLQVLDELIYGELNDSNILQIQNQLAEMYKYCEVYVPKKVYSYQAFVASRQNLVRLFAMGLVGFDVPASDNAISDAVTTLTSMQNSLLLYKPEIEKANVKEADTLFLLLQNSIRFLKKTKDFNQLDRFTFLKENIDPLYKKLLEIHILLGYELPNETNISKTAWNYQSKSLFSSSFLDKNYYVDVAPEFLNPTTASLGRLLFYEPLLSLNHERSCASCHNPEKAFTDGKEKSEAFDHLGTVKRNSPTVINSVFADRYFHDLRARNLTDQMEHVITNSKEFNTDWDKIVQTLTLSSEYQELFANAFNTDKSNAINSQNVRIAMAAYVSSLNALNSKFDKFIRNEIVLKGSEGKSIQRGFNLFMGKAACGTCHFAPIFNGLVPPYYTESESEILGVPENPYDAKPLLGVDKGRGQALLREQVDFYEYSFKTPTLRNIDLTAPYMHNGSYKDLEKVMEFYNLGGGAGIGIHLQYQTLSTDPLELSKKEIADIIIFMKSLTDIVDIEEVPKVLPKFDKKPEWDGRKPGGLY